MPERPPDFSPVLAALHSSNVRFVLIGGLAMAAHGSDYITQDIDIGYSRDAQNIRLLSQALAGMHPRLRGFPEGLPFFWNEGGLAVLQTLRENARARTLPVIMLTHDMSTADIYRAWELGVDSFQSKRPDHINALTLELSAKINRIVKSIEEGASISPLDL